jgi:hypothetical protein
MHLLYSESERHSVRDPVQQAAVEGFVFTQIGHLQSHVNSSRVEICLPIPKRIT